jgi:dipeptidyl aminopeptidase/acylaminoacyl peptidase
VTRCLEKDVMRRFQSAIDLRNELEDCRDELHRGEADTGAGQARRKPSVHPVIPLAVILVAGSLGFTLRAFVSEERSVTLPTLTRPRQITATVGMEAYPTWSPDGSRIAYTGLTGGDNWDIWVSQVSGGPPVNLTSDYDGADMHPSWSPDGSQIAFSSSRDDGGAS